jgi:hypothetical protein
MKCYLITKFECQIFSDQISSGPLLQRRPLLKSSVDINNFKSKLKAGLLERNIHLIFVTTN